MNIREILLGEKRRRVRVEGPNAHPFALDSWGDGDAAPPANVPEVRDAIEIHPLIRLDGEQLFLNQMLDVSASLQRDGDGGYTVDFGAEW